MSLSPKKTVTFDYGKNINSTNPNEGGIQRPELEMCWDFF